LWDGSILVAQNINFDLIQEDGFRCFIDFVDSQDWFPIEVRIFGAARKRTISIDIRASKLDGAMLENAVSLVGPQTPRENLKVSDSKVPGAD
jgi:hypothetical protein